jgi:DNA modification methylase/ParB-like chromosome segregation protein Spo0J
VKLHSIAFEDIYIEENRQRKNLSAESLLELAGSISQVGLIHPVVVRRDDQDRVVLVAGERRLRSLEYIWNFGQNVKCGEYSIPVNQVPCVYLGEIDPIQAYEIELEENIRRLDISWQERAQATARLAQLKKEIDGEEPSPAKLAEEVGLSPSAEGGGGSAAQAVRQDIILAKFLTDPDIAGAKSRAEAFKLLKRKEDSARNAEVGRQITATLAGEHRLIKGDCLEILPTLPDSSFDVILTDPPYGINAQDFGDSAGTGGAVGGHFYDDSPEAFEKLMAGLAKESIRIAKAQAHLYVFCDIEWFLYLRRLFDDQGWKVFRTPLVFVNPSGSRAPWPQKGPQRKYQLVLYAIKGNRPVTAVLGDVITCSSDPNQGHHAQKPVALYTDLLRRSVRAADSVLDPFAGTGTIFPAAHGLKCKATGIEMDEAACGIAAKRLAALK